MDKLSLIIKHFCYIIKHGFKNYTKKTIKIIQVNSPENENVKKVSEEINILVIRTAHAVSVMISTHGIRSKLADDLALQESSVWLTCQWHCNPNFPVEI